MRFKALIVCLPLLLGGCNATAKNQNTSVVVDSKYTQINTYTNVEWVFDNEMRCNVKYIHYKSGSTEIDYIKKWCVYLTGFYIAQDEIDYNSCFYECIRKRGSNDYYLVVKQ